MIRSTWYYWAKYKEFLKWIDHLQTLSIPVWNPPSLLRWNSNKQYLQELEKKGIPIVPTHWLKTPDKQFSLPWTEAVVKPVISGGAHLTFRVNPSNWPSQETQKNLDEILKFGPIMAQPFLPEILEEGEYSLLFYGGKYSHAVIKKGPQGEFRVQRLFGGTVQAIAAPKEAIAFAEKVLSLIDLPLLYARVDLIQQKERFLLMELEIIEPNLFFLHDPEAGNRFADALEKKI